MSDLFSLAPEGQAWSNADAESNKAKPEDYDPRWYAGSGSAVFRGIAEGGVGLAQSTVELSKLSPTYVELHAAFPELAAAVDQKFDGLQKSLNDSRLAVKPAPNSQGIAADVLEGLGIFAPAMGASMLGGPVAGGAVAFGSTYEPTRQDFLAKGVNEDTATTLALEQGAANALGMALPAGVGKTLTTRLLSGVGINTGFGMANRFAMSETLEANGYSDIAKQYRVWDKQAIIVDSVLGAAFGGVHHLASARAEGAQNIPGDNEPGSTLNQPLEQAGQGFNGENAPTEQQPISTTEIQFSAEAESAGQVTADTPAAGAPAVRPSDIDAAHVINEGLHYDLESSPVVHSGEASINSHVAAMDEASRQMMAGEPVNVSTQIRGLDGIARPDAVELGRAEQAAYAEAYRSSGIPEVVRDAPAQEIPPVRETSSFSRQQEAETVRPEQVSTDPETGESISSNSYDLMVARDMSQANPDITIAHPDTGEPVSLAQALADLDNQLATVQKESNVYSVAATCFLRNS